ncbi:MAG: nucleotide exchange factor GrpE [Nitrospirota bacterium]|nr:nucleotide exchange factor GrpE [Nitrospirota bacterium]
MSTETQNAAAGGNEEAGTPDQVETPEGMAAPEAPETAEAARAPEADALAEAEQRYVRLYAEFENYKKRVGRENEDFRKYANEGLLKELLGVVDNLDLAIGHGREAENNEKMLEGVEMIRKQFMDVLEKFGVSSIPALGQPFDPSVHQAISQIETTDHADGAVAEEYRKGYFFHQRVLRPAMVVVAKNKG